MPRPSYDLHTLGWQSFQDLCLAVTRTILGQTVMSVLDTHDGGRDGAFSGTWVTQKGEELKGEFVIQCKFTGKPSFSLRLSDVSDEIEKARRLVAEGRCDSYVLISNANITGRFELALHDALTSVGVAHTVIHGGDWLRQQIQMSPTLRAQVPRVYGLGDLSQILDSRANAQTRVILDTMRGELETVVVTSAYQQAVSALEEHSLVLLVGAPASGKTTIASQLTMAALDMWEAQTYKLDGPDGIRSHWNPHEKHQFFWIDDAFGVTQYDAAIVETWNRQLSMISAMIKQGVRIVLTSRDYIHARALEDLKGPDLPVLEEAKIVVDVEQLTLREKEQILYNHVKLGNQSSDFRRKIKHYLPGVVSNADFAPETARRLGNSRFTDGLVLSEEPLRDFVERPQEFLEETIWQLDNDSRAALVLLFMHGDLMDGSFGLTAEVVHALTRLGSDPARCITALRALEGSFVRLHQEADSPIWRFKHPTMSDAVAAHLGRRGDLVDILVEGSRPDKLIAQVTCGDVGIEKAVVVPEVLFDKVAEKLDHVFELSPNNGTPARHRLRNRNGIAFLANRSSSEFLAHYAARRPGLAELIDIRPEYLSSDLGARIVWRLHEHGILSEEERGRILSRLLEAALDEQDFWAVDVAALKNGLIADLVDERELNQLEEALKSEVIPLIDQERESWEGSYDSGSADSHMEPLQSYCDSAKEFFQGDPEVTREIEEQEGLIDAWLEEHWEDDPDDDWKAHVESEANLSNGTERSIFEDIDAE